MLFPSSRADPRRVPGGAQHAPPEIQPKKKKRAGDDERAETGAAAAPAPPPRRLPASGRRDPRHGRGEGCEEGQGDGHLQAPDSIDDGEKEKTRAGADAIVEFKGEAGTIVPETKKRYNYSAQIIPRLASKWPKPPWHAP